MPICLAAVLVAADQPKLTEQELITRHLASIGDAAALSAARSCGAAFAVRYQILLGGAGTADGQAKLLSDGRKLRLVMEFNSNQYRGEDLVSDGSKAGVATTTAGLRDPLGGFLYTRRDLLTQGLIGGTLSTAWPLLDTGSLQPKLHYNGLKKIDGRDLVELRYEPRKGASDARVFLYFEPETYRHVLTLYRVDVPVTEARSLNPGTKSQNGAATQEGKITLKESFSDFRVSDGLTLPTHWTLELTNEGQSTWTMRWDMTSTALVHSAMDPAAFKVP